MFSSTEVRWFFNEPLPQALSRWFALFDPISQAPRTDYYLNFTDNADIGIKLREEQIQIKHVVADLGVQHFTNAEGQVIKYEKWSFPVVSNSEWATLVNRPDVWVPVKKIRQMLKFTLGGGYPNKVRMDEPLDNGCEVELSKVEVKDKEYWSLAFEAFGSSAELNLQKTIREIFESKSCPFYFEGKKSLGYARLIHDIKT